MINIPTRSSTKIRMALVFMMLGISLSLAQQHSQHSSPARPDMPPMSGMMSEMQMPMDHMDMMQMMMGMMDSRHSDRLGASLMGLSGPAFEQAFLSMMIPHHQSAVEMSLGVLSSTSDNDIRTLAEAIVSAQEKEIEEMQAWLTELGGTNLAAQSVMVHSMDSMMSTMHASEQTTNAEQAFLEAMIEHHLSAIDMASQALRQAKDLRVLQLAVNIMASQATEVLQMQQKLAFLNE